MLFKVATLTQAPICCRVLLVFLGPPTPLRSLGKGSAGVWPSALKGEGQPRPFKNRAFTPLCIPTGKNEQEKKVINSALYSTQAV